MEIAPTMWASNHEIRLSKNELEMGQCGKKSRRVCHCDNPCTTSSCGRMVYIYPEQNLRAYPVCISDTDEWDSTYKILINIEKSINHFKGSFCVAGRTTQNEKTLHADLLLAGIAGLLTVMVANKIHNYKYIRSLKPLIAYVYFLYILLQADIPICFVFVLPFSFCISVIKKITMKVVFSLYTLIKQVCFAITYHIRFLFTDSSS